MHLVRAVTGVVVGLAGVVARRAAYEPAVVGAGFEAAANASLGVDVGDQEEDGDEDEESGYHCVAYC